MHLLTSKGLAITRLTLYALVDPTDRPREKNVRTAEGTTKKDAVVAAATEAAIGPTVIVTGLAIGTGTETATEIGAATPSPAIVATGGTETAIATGRGTGTGTLTAVERERMTKWMVGTRRERNRQTLTTRPLLLVPCLLSPGTALVVGIVRPTLETEGETETADTFFEEKLGEGTVMDSRIVTDRMSRRSKGIAYVEFRSVDLVDKAIDLTGTVVMGRPIHIQLTESERNKLHPGDGNLNLPPGVTAPHGGAMQLYVGSLHFNLTESDIRQVFEPFGDLEFVDLHKDPMTGRSKGYAFVQYKRSEDAKMALEQMEGFELAGRTLRVNTVHEKGTARYTQTESLDDSGGGNLNAASRQALMQKLARIEPAHQPEPISRPNIPQNMQSRSVLLKNMFNPEEETEPDWDRDLADDVKGECQEKYGKVEAIKVERETQGEIYVKFDTIETAKKAVQGLNGRWFGGNQVSATFISDAIMQAHQ
ncbi:Splicing factor CC1-like protein [Mycena venus]|uniref:Splicing factor CC1-like protein n=1 Tax=Mycena venus TaxID=2733690 RepID=A0A8H7CTN7_9AGAR|nr:Splicing factor CC1-like protein [Mycena venus]